MDSPPLPNPPTPSSQPQTASTPPPPAFKPSPSKNTLLYFLIVLLLVALGYLGYQNWHLQQQVNRFNAIIKVDNTPYNFSSPSPFSSSSSDPTVNWKTYTNSQFGFSLQIPPEATANRRDPDPFPIAIEISSLKPREGGGGGPEFIGWQIIISENQLNPNNLTLREWAKEENLVSDLLLEQGNQTSVEDTTIGGKPAIHWKSSGGNVRLIYYLINRDNEMILISVNNSEPSTENTTQQILSTFKFSDS